MKWIINLFLYKKFEFFIILDEPDKNKKINYAFINYCLENQNKLILISNNNFVFEDKIIKENIQHDPPIKYKNCNLRILKNNFEDFQKQANNVIKKVLSKEENKEFWEKDINYFIEEICREKDIRQKGEGLKKLILKYAPIYGARHNQTKEGFRINFDNDLDDMKEQAKKFKDSDCFYKLEHIEKQFLDSIINTKNRYFSTRNISTIFRYENNKKNFRQMSKRELELENNITNNKWFLGKSVIDINFLYQFNQNKLEEKIDLLFKKNPKAFTYFYDKKNEDWVFTSEKLMIKRREHFNMNEEELLEKINFLDSKGMSNLLKIINNKKDIFEKFDIVQKIIKNLNNKNIEKINKEIFKKINIEDYKKDEDSCNVFIEKTRFKYLKKGGYAAWKKMYEEKEDFSNKCRKEYFKMIK